MLNKIRDHRDRYTFYNKYEYKYLLELFNKIEARLACSDPKDFIDTPEIIPLLIKAPWPDVHIKQDLVAEGKHCIFYGDSRKEAEKDGINNVR